MFAARFFNLRAFAARYFPKVGAAVGLTMPAVHTLLDSARTTHTLADSAVATHTLTDSGRATHTLLDYALV